jgi:hypothetical protein
VKLPEDLEHEKMKEDKLIITEQRKETSANKEIGKHDQIVKRQTN